uniref:Putative chemosensory protein CSP9 n=2 Tax=Solenopsis invicta TaxID=13686 RepID=B7TVH7_SOLIN|nr:putative chemosensory protein CSP9 [Solenopsis invicta]
MCVLAEDLHSELDDLDIPKILANDAERQGVIDCILENASCTELETKAAAAIKDALKTNCQACGDKRKENMKIITDWFNQNQPDTWTLVVAKVNS